MTFMVVFNLCTVVELKRKTLKVLIQLVIFVVKTIQEASVYDHSSCSLNLCVVLLCRHYEQVNSSFHVD